MYILVYLFAIIVVVAEGFFLRKYGISPYEGDLVHQPPLLFALLEPLQPVLFKADKEITWFCNLLFMVIEIVSALLVLSVFKGMKERLLLAADEKSKEKTNAIAYKTCFLSDYTVFAL